MSAPTKTPSTTKSHALHARCPTHAHTCHEVPVDAVVLEKRPVSVPKVGALGHIVPEPARGTEVGPKGDL